MARVSNRRILSRRGRLAHGAGDEELAVVVNEVKDGFHLSNMEVPLIQGQPPSTGFCLFKKASLHLDFLVQKYTYA